METDTYLVCDSHLSGRVALWLLDADDHPVRCIGHYESGTRASAEAISDSGNPLVSITYRQGLATGGAE